MGEHVFPLLCFALEYGIAMKQEAKGQLADSLQPWVSLAITIHFFAIIISLAANLSPSELEHRLLKVLTPYTVALHQDYPSVPLEMTRGMEIDFPCHFEVRHPGAEAGQWKTVAPPDHLGSALDRRWRTFTRMTNIVAAEQNEPLVHLLFEHCVRRAESLTTSPPVESVRLVRRASLSYVADQANLAGELPPAGSQDHTLFECRVVKLNGDRIRLIPVLESLRTSKSLLKPAATAKQPPTSPAVDENLPEEQSSLEVEP